jgi:acyl-CoA thioesterase II
VADTTHAVRVDRPGHAPELHFPASDVRLDLFEGEPDTPDGIRSWSTDRPAVGSTLATTATDSWSGTPDLSGADVGRDVVRQVLAPPAGFEWATDHVTFDHDRVRVELVDGYGDDDPADAVTVTRWPTWGDALDLIELLDVQPDGGQRYVSTTRDNWQRPVVEASQILGQTLVAASREAGGRRVVSAHMAFARTADTHRPLHFDLDVVTAGRTFTTFVAHVSQGGRPCAVGTVLLDTTTEDVVRHSVPAPAVAGPNESPALDMGVTGRDLRVVDGAYTSDPHAPVGPPELDAWIRFRKVPDDPALHAALLAQFTGHLSIAAALRPHAGVGQQSAHRTLSMGINAIAISFHGEVHADQWLLYHHLSTFAGAGMSHAEGRVHDERGDLVASFTVDAMIRSFAPDSTVDDGSSL